MSNFTIKPILSILFILLGCLSLFSQNLPIAFDIVKNTEKNQVDIVVKEYQNVVGFQFGIQFDKNDLEYLGMEIPQAEIQDGNILDNQVGNNILVVYVSANTQPVNFDPGTVILSYKFADDISDVYFCASEDEIKTEGAIDVNGTPTTNDIYFSESCDEPSPCILVCNDQVYVSIPNSGSITFTETGMEDMFLEGQSCNSSNLKLSLYDSTDDYQNGLPLDNLTFTMEDDGRTLVYEIREVDEQTACWGTIKLSHSMAGDLMPPADRDATCGEDITVDNVSDAGAPLFYVAQDNPPLGSFGVEDDIEEIGRYSDISGVITGLSVYVVDEYTDLDNCNLGFLNRHFYLFDANGTELQVAIQKIKIVAGDEFSESAVSFPEEITVECDITPEITGSPNIEETSCQLTGSSYSDEIIDNDEGKKVVRTWTVVDWCSGIVLTHTQIINSMCSDSNDDTLSPVAICFSDLSVSLNNNGEAKIWAEDIDAGSYDNSGTINLLIRRSTQDEFAEYIELTNNDIGEVEVVLMVTDPAGNFTTCWTIVNVSPPSEDSDCLLVCNAEVLINIEQGQTIAINQALNHHLFLDSGTSCPDGTLIINLFDEDGNDVSSKVFTDLDDGYKGTYKVIDTNSQNSCFGSFFINVTAEALVWPGDTNNDGVVNNFDILNIGIGYEAEGVIRSNASINWEGQATLDWDHKFDNGLNFKFADADGSGVINYSDMEAIDLNWNEEHEFRGESDQNRSATDIPIFFQAGDYETNKLIEIPIHMGVNNLPADNIYGVAFSISYDPSMADANSASINTNNSWFTQTDNDLLKIEKNITENGMIHFAMVRKDHENLSGMGVVANLEIFFDEIDGEVSESNLSIENLRFVDSKGVELPALQITSSVNVMNQTTAITNINQSNISVYPNPSTGLINIATDAVIESISLMNLAGQVCKTFEGDLKTIDISGLNNQLYVLKIQTNEETVVAKVTLLK